MPSIIKTEIKPRQVDMDYDLISTYDDGSTIVQCVSYEKVHERIEYENTVAKVKKEEEERDKDSLVEKENKKRIRRGIIAGASIVVTLWAMWIISDLSYVFFRSYFWHTYQSLALDL